MQYSTPDTKTAAYLIQSGFPMVGISYQDKPNGIRQATFAFDDTTELQNHVTIFQSGDAVINIVDYERIKGSLLDLIRAGKR